VKRSPYFYVALLGLLIVAVNIWLVFRVYEQGRACHAQCGYGDKDCRERCDKLGHCPFQD